MKTIEDLIEISKRPKYKKDFKEKVLEKWNNDIEIAGDNFEFPFKFEIKVPDELKNESPAVLYTAIHGWIDDLVHTKEYRLYLQEAKHEDGIISLTFGYSAIDPEEEFRELCRLVFNAFVNTKSNENT